ncbi:hypothetical protein OH77DRAFT_1419186 [Trametes cingulata]|nr:hypothetical protein OH77DRAFT_1419186 [Trametes cingulata]
MSVTPAISIPQRVDDDHDIAFSGGNQQPTSTSIESAEAVRPIDRLPAELLITIFQHVQLLYGWPNPSDYRRALLWLRFTWVCHRWRSVALGARLLWAAIYSHYEFESTDWLSAFLERAAGANLDITLHYLEDLVPTLEVIFAYADYVQSLTLILSAYDKHRFPALAQSFPALMPALEQLVIDYNHDESGWESFAEMLPAHGRFPRLRHLTLSSFNFPWTSPVYTCLCSLVIDYPPEKLSFTQFLIILQACPRLESLTARRSLAEVGEDGALGGDVNLDRVVELRCLRSLKLYDSFRRAAPLCDRLVVPPTCSITVDYYLRELRGGIGQVLESLDSSSILPCQRVFLAHFAEAESLSLSVEMEHIILQARRAKGIPVSFTVSTYNWQNVVYGPTERIESLYPSARPPSIQFLLSYRSLSEVYSPRSWWGLFSTFSTLDSIVLGSSDDCAGPRAGAFQTLERALRARGAGSDNVNAPDLRSLEVFHAIVDNALAKALLSLVRARASEGVPLAEVSFVDSYSDGKVYSDRFLSQLGELVKTTIAYRTLDGRRQVVEAFRS